MTTKPIAPVLNAAQDADMVLSRSNVGDDSIAVMASGAISIQVGGLVIVKTLRAWHELAAAPPATPDKVSGEVWKTAFEQEQLKFQQETRYTSMLTRSIAALLKAIYDSGGEIGPNHPAVLAANRAINEPVNCASPPAPAVERGKCLHLRSKWKVGGQSGTCSDCGASLPIGPPAAGSPAAGEEDQSSDGGHAARNSAEDVAGRLPDKGSAAANEAVSGYAPAGNQSGSLETMLKHSRKQLAQRTRPMLAKHANETLAASTPTPDDGRSDAELIAEAHANGWADFDGRKACKLADRLALATKVIEAARECRDATEVARKPGTTGSTCRLIRAESELDTALADFDRAKTGGGE